MAGSRKLTARVSVQWHIARCKRQTLIWCFCTVETFLRKGLLSLVSGCWFHHLGERRRCYYLLGPAHHPTNHIILIVVIIVIITNIIVMLLSPTLVIPKAPEGLAVCNIINCGVGQRVHDNWFKLWGSLKYTLAGPRKHMDWTPILLSGPINSAHPRDYPTPFCCDWRERCKVVSGKLLSYHIEELNAQIHCISLVTHARWLTSVHNSGHFWFRLLLLCVTTAQSRIVKQADLCGNARIAADHDFWKSSLDWSAEVGKVGTYSNCHVMLQESHFHQLAFPCLGSHMLGSWGISLIAYISSVRFLNHAGSASSLAVSNYHGCKLLAWRAKELRCYYCNAGSSQHCCTSHQGIFSSELIPCYNLATANAFLDFLDNGSCIKFTATTYDYDTINIQRVSAIAVWKGKNHFRVPFSLILILTVILVPTLNNCWGFSALFPVRK